MFKVGQKVYIVEKISYRYGGSDSLRNYAKKKVICTVTRVSKDDDYCEIDIPGSPGWAVEDDEIVPADKVCIFCGNDFSDLKHYCGIKFGGMFICEKCTP